MSATGGRRGGPRTRVAIVIPVFNEQENVGRLAEELQAELDAAPFDYIVVFVDDGSDDDTFGRLESACRCRPRQFGIVRLRRNLGQSAALAAGFRQAAVRQCDVVVTLDGDGQNPPGEIPRLVAGIEAGQDVVCGWRYRRRDALFTRRIPSLVANRLIRWVTRVPIHDFGCSLRAYRSDALVALDLRGELHRLLPVTLAESTSRISEVRVAHRPRIAGRSKYGPGRTLRVLLDVFALVFLRSYFRRPLHGFGLLGLLLAVLGGAVMVYLLVDKVAFGASIGDRPLLTLGAVLLLSGVQFFGLGLLGEVLVRAHVITTSLQSPAADVTGLDTDTPEEYVSATQDEGASRDLAGEAGTAGADDPSRTTSTTETNLERPSASAEP